MKGEREREKLKTNIHLTKKRLVEKEENELKK